MPESALDLYFAPGERWAAELQRLRVILLSCGLRETLKWRAPCYTRDGRNVAILGRLRGHCVLSFFHGASLDDLAGVLQPAGPNSQQAKVFRASSVDEIDAHEDAIRELIAQADRLKAPTKQSPAPRVPVELASALVGSPALQDAFMGLTPGRQRGYCLYISGAKTAKAREARVARCEPRILRGKGLRDCICGLSKRMPRCDGSHSRS